MTMRSRPVRAAWAGVLACLAVGCGGQGDISGTVTYKGKPVVTGSVTFYGPDKVAHIGAIDEQGNYKVAGVPTGTAEIAVASPDPVGSGLGNAIGGKAPKPTNPNDPPPAAAASKVTRPAGWQLLPAHFGEAKSSKLTREVRGGDNKIDLALE